MLSTIGYEGSALGDFVATLKSVGVEVVFDIRERAQSRRPGFSKTALSLALAEAGIAYFHLPELGDPKDGREAARRGDQVRFRQIFAQVLTSEAARAALARIIAESADVHACMLCYERDPNECHRKLVSNRIDSITGGKTTHLGVRRFEQAA